jgi:triacylglycerol lipase
MGPITGQRFGAGLGRLIPLKFIEPSRYFLGVTLTMMIPKLKAPIFLVHGLLGYDRLKVGAWTLASYFRGIPETLERAGNRVLMTRVSPTAAVSVRAAQLKSYLDQKAPGEPVHIVAHSMGGLDARYLVSRLGMADRVLTLTTIATPHRGTAFADWGLQRFERLVRPVLALFNVPGQAFYDLTTAKCREFNAQVPDVPGVRYFSVAGRHEIDLFCPEWLLSQQIVERLEGPNDGLVSVSSASYGERTDVWEGDHLSLINWPNYRARLRGRWRDQTPNYGGLLCRLADEGF